MSEPSAQPAANTSAPAQDKAAKKPGGNIIKSLVILTIVLMVVLSGLMTIGLNYVAIIVFIGMLPGAVAYILDRRPGKAASRTILGFNIAGLLPQVLGILSNPSPNNLAREMMSNPYTWLWIYLFAAFGWVVIHMVPQIAYLFLSLKAEFTVKRLRATQEKMLKEWGEELRK